MERKRRKERSPVVRNGLDIEAKSRTNNTGILTIDFQYNCCLPRIIKTPIGNKT